MDSPSTPRDPAVRTTVPVRLRTGLLVLGTSVVTLALVAWGGGRITAEVVDLESQQVQSELRLVQVEKLMGNPPITVVGTDAVSRPHEAREGE